MSEAFKKRVKALEALGVQYYRENEYRGEVGKGRKSYDLNLFKSVYIPFTPNEWCSISMSEGDQYIGGCCGTASAIQDIISGCFRIGGGWMDIEDLANMFDLFKSHGDSFDAFKRKLLETKVEHYKKNWKKINVWEKLALIWFIVKDFYGPKPVSGYVKRDEKSEIKNTIHILSSALYSLSWGHLFERDREERKEKGENMSQHQANYALILSKVIPSIKILHDEIEVLDVGPMEGYALIDRKRDSVCSNHYGLCVYDSKKEVARIFDLWRKSEQEYEEERGGIYKGNIDDKVGVRPIRISLEEGLVFTGDFIDL